MNPFSVRKARWADMETLLQFEQGVIAAERPFDCTLKTEKTHYYDLNEMIKADHIELLVAEQDGLTIGSGYARIETSKHYLQHPQHAYLGFMFTHPDHRGKGVNLSILNSLKTWAAAQQVYELRLEVYTQNTSAIKAYGKAGFHALMLEMRMSTH